MEVSGGVRSVFSIRVNVMLGVEVQTTRAQRRDKRKGRRYELAWGKNWFAVENYNFKNQVAEEAIGDRRETLDTTALAPMLKYAGNQDKDTAFLFLATSYEKEVADIYASQGRTSELLSLLPLDSQYVHSEVLEELFGSHFQVAELKAEILLAPGNSANPPPHEIMDALTAMGKKITMLVTCVKEDASVLQQKKKLENLEPYQQLMEEKQSNLYALMKKVYGNAARMKYVEASMEFASEAMKLVKQANELTEDQLFYQNEKGVLSGLSPVCKSVASTQLGNLYTALAKQLKSTVVRGSELRRGAVNSKVMFRREEEEDQEEFEIPEHVASDHMASL